MKKILGSITLFALAGILFSSCSNSSKLSITKRHYRSGYCIDFSKRIPTATVAKTVSNSRHKSVPVIIAANPENQVAVNTTAMATPVNFQNTPTPLKLQVNNTKTTSQISTDKNMSVANNNNINESPVLQNEHTLSEGNGGGDRASEREALSLLWIVIVVILILWLIGIIAGGFGLGGLINLLLLIALILFILWLLRVW